MLFLWNSKINMNNFCHVTEHNSDTFKQHDEMVK